MLPLTSIDRTMYVQALENLRPLNVPLNVAVLEYVWAAKRLPPGSTLKEAVDFFHNAIRHRWKNAQCARSPTKCWRAKHAAKLSEVYLWDFSVA